VCSMRVSLPRQSAVSDCSPEERRVPLLVLLRFSLSASIFIFREKFPNIPQPFCFTSRFGYQGFSSRRLSSSLYGWRASPLPTLGCLKNRPGFFSLGTRRRSACFPDFLKIFCFGLTSPLLLVEGAPSPISEHVIPHPTSG